MGQHESPALLLYKERLAFVDRLSDEQNARLFKAIVHFSCNGEDTNFDDDLTCATLWDILRADLMRSGESYRNKQIEGRIGGLIRSLKAGQKISDDAFDFLRENNVDEAYLRDRGVTDESVLMRFKGT